jgi:hypothetical protein
MLWAIVSSVFVMYLYRTLNTTTDAETTGEAFPAEGIDDERAKLDSRIDAIETIAAGKARGMSP